MHYIFLRKCPLNIYFTIQFTGDLGNRTYFSPFLLRYFHENSQVFMSLQTIFPTSQHSNFILAVVTQRITARKVECGDVGKTVARREIEMIKKEDRPLVLTIVVLTVVRSSVRRWKRGEGEMYGFLLLSAHSRTVNFVQKSGWVLLAFTDLAAPLQKLLQDSLWHY